MQQKDLVRLDRILALLSSDLDGERASAAKAATALIKKHGLTWWEVLEGRALGTRAAAAESRIRQLQAHNQMLEKQVRRLKDKLETPEHKRGASPETD